MQTVILLNFKVDEFFSMVINYLTVSDFLLRVEVDVSNFLVSGNATN